MSMKKVISLILLLLAFPLFVGGAFEIEGIMGMPSLLRALVLTLAAQILVLTSGQIAGPTRTSVGFVRTVAAFLFFVGALALPRALLVLLSQKIRNVEILDSNQLTWAFVESLVSLGLLFYSVKAWQLSKGFKRITNRRSEERQVK